MVDKDDELVDLMVEQSEDEARDKPEARKKGGRFVQSAFPGGPAKQALRFSPRRIYDDGLSTKRAPGPGGPDAVTLIEEARRRRRERAEEERDR